MRKIIVLIMTLLMSLTLSAAAFASPVKEINFYGNAQMGSIGDGIRGYSWYHSNANPSDPVMIKSLVNYSDRVFVKGITSYTGHPNKTADKWQFYHDRNGNIHYYYAAGYTNSDRHGEWFYYIDDNGVKHYFYQDSNLEYQWHHYKDKDGITQYYYTIAGWKIK